MVLQPSYAKFTPSFVKTVVEVKVSGLSHVTNLWLLVCKGTFPIKTPFLKQTLPNGSHTLWNATNGRLI